MESGEGIMNEKAATVIRPGVMSLVALFAAGCGSESGSNLEIVGEWGQETCALISQSLPGVPLDVVARRILFTISSTGTVTAWARGYSDTSCTSAIANDEPVIVFNYLDLGSDPLPAEPERRKINVSEVPPPGGNPGHGDLVIEELTTYYAVQSGNRLCTSQNWNLTSDFLDLGDPSLTAIDYTNCLVRQ
jgi:hypothetical protein